MENASGEWWTEDGRGQTPARGHGPLGEWLQCACSRPHRSLPTRRGLRSLKNAQRHAWRWPGQGEVNTDKGEKEAGRGFGGKPEASICAICQTRVTRLLPVMAGDRTASSLAAGSLRPRPWGLLPAVPSLTIRPGTRFSWDEGTQMWGDRTKRWSPPRACWPST